MSDERTEFEAAMRAVPCPEHWTFGDDGTGGYHNNATEWAWIGWQQARAAAPTPAQVPAAPSEACVLELAAKYGLPKSHMLLMFVADLLTEPAAPPQAAAPQPAPSTQPGEPT